LHRFRKAVAYFDGDPEVNVTKEIGKFYQNKTMEYSHWVLRKIEC
jgi:hypothetical protein